MALLRIDHLPKTVGVNLPLLIILPDQFRGRKTLRTCPVLFLLHGLSDDASAWQRYTNIEILARKHNLFVVMPSVGRSFYADMANGQAYFSYLTEELPEYLRRVFRLDLSRQNMMVAGLSMGGYGAFKLAFLRPEMFRAALSFSGAFLNLLIKNPPQTEKGKKTLQEFDLVFGGLDKLPGSQNDPDLWLRQAAQKPETLPELFMTCGLEDSLLESNRQFYQQATSLGIPIDYNESPGGHEWFFWGEQLQNWLDYLLLKEE